MPARFYLGAHRLEKRDEPCGIDSAGPVHPVDGSSLSQRMRNPMLSNTTHAFARTTGSAEVVKLACLRLNLSRINAVHSANKARCFPAMGLRFCFMSIIEGRSRRSSMLVNTLNLN